MRREIHNEPPELMLLPPEHYPTLYDFDVHEKAELYKRATGKPVFNPLCLEPRDIFDMDIGFMAEHALWGDWIQYYQDMNLRPDSLR